MTKPFDAASYRYPSSRSLVYGRNGMVCASQPLAAQAGIEMLRRGGNAFDAVLAAAACLTVVEPMSNTLGGDAFGILWSGGKLYGLNASGPAPQALTRNALIKQGFQSMPRYGWGAVTVPGMISGWAEMNRRFGTLSMGDILRPAIQYARWGFPASPVITRLWESIYPVHRKNCEQRFYEELNKYLLPNGKLPEPGELIRFPEMADTLEEIAETEGESFYRGRIADRIARFSENSGGFLGKDDLVAFRAEWVEPISVRYRGYDVWELPPNGHGLVVLMTLNLLKEMDLSGGREDPGVIHRIMEALKLAFTDGRRFITDPAAMKAELSVLLSDAYADERRSLIGEEALYPEPGNPYCGNTVYLNAADGEGNMVSWIQSCYERFGSGVTLPGTGIIFHNRGYNFTMDEKLENCVAAGKKPYHTIIPGFLTKGNRAIGPFGVMGGFMQPQGHVQVLTNILNFGLNPQEALDAPRWMWTGEKNMEMEKGYSEEIRSALLKRGHRIHCAENSLNMGRGQIIWRDETGTLCGASEPRTDGMAAAI